jgi:hypothetical protein
VTLAAVGSQVVTDSSGSNVTNLASTAFNLPAGHLVTVTVKWEVAAAVTQVTDTAGNTYTALAAADDGVNGQHAKIFYCLSSAASATNVVTINWASANAQFITATIRWSSYSGSVSLTGQATATGTSATPVTASFTAGGMAVAAISDFAGSTTTPDSGWTEDSDVAAVGGPTITVQPVSQRVAAGSSAVYSVTATGGSLTYQWQSNVSGSFANISGETASTYTVSSVAAGTAYAVRVVVTDGSSVNSNPADVWAPAVEPHPWQGLYLRGGGRNFFLANLLIPQSGASAFIYDDAIWGTTVAPVGFDLVQTGSITLTGTQTLTGDLEPVVEWDFQPPLSLAAAGTLSITGDLQFASALALVPSTLPLSSTLSVTGDLQFTLPTLTLAQTTPLALTGAMTVTGDLLILVPSLTLVQTGTIGLTATLATIGDLGIGVSFPLTQTAAIALSGTATTTGDLAITAPGGLELTPTAAIALSGSAALSGDIGIGTNFDLAGVTLALNAGLSTAGDVALGIALTTSPVALASTLTIAGDLTYTVGGPFVLVTSPIALTGTFGQSAAFPELAGRPAGFGPLSFGDAPKPIRPKRVRKDLEKLFEEPTPPAPPPSPRAPLNTTALRAALTPPSPVSPTKPLAALIEAEVAIIQEQAKQDRKRRKIAALTRLLLED